MSDQILRNTYVFTDFSSPVHARFTELSKDELYIVDVEDLFETYLSSFPDGTNPLFRERTEHDCNCCKQFIRRLGCLVTADLRTVWDVHEQLPYPYNEVARTLHNVVRQAPIISVFRTKERQYGTDHNFDTKTNQRWNHFHGKVADKHFSTDPATERGRLNENATMLRRACEELSPSAVETVLDLIEANSLYRGEEHLQAVQNFRTLQNAYLAAPDRNLFAWANITAPGVRFRNTVIGTLITDLSQGTDLEAAVRMFESKVAPHNYKRPTALITPRMIEQASETIDKLGLEPLLNRRFAKLSDVSVNNVLFVDRSVKPQLKGGIADLLASEVRTKPVKIDNPTPITGSQFLQQLPNFTSIQLLLQNQHMGNFVSLTTGDPGLFRWDNGFAWSYDGDVADSVKERVKKAGGNVTAPFRVSLSWFNYDDLDLHCRTPNHRHIYYGDKQGHLDVDMNAGGGSSREAVENIVFQTFIDGVYHFDVNNFRRRETIDVGFELEFEFRGQVHRYSYDKAVPNNATIRALSIQISRGDLIDVKLASGLVGGSFPQQKWGLTTEQLVPVDIMMLSPNHWDGQSVGNRHFMFFMKNCVNPNPARGIYNEFLRSDLEQHRKVFEVLGAKTKCPPATEQLSGVGFSSTRNDKVTLVANNQAFEVDFSA